MSTCEYLHVHTLTDVFSHVSPKGAEWIGKVEIRCAQTKLVAKLDFKPMGWLGMWGGE